MEIIGFSSKFINSCKSIYNIARMAIKTGKGLSDWIELTAGLFQGETISSDLFI